MNAFVFRLAPVLRLRRSEEQVARDALRRANAALERARENERGALARYETLVRTTGEVSLEELARERAGTELAARQLAQLVSARRIAAQLAAEAERAWIESEWKVRALERLEERQRAEHAIELDRFLAREVDDLVTANFARRRHASVGGSR